MGIASTSTGIPSSSPAVILETSTRVSVNWEDLTQDSRIPMGKPVLKERGVGNEASLFNCSLYFVDSPTKSQPGPGNKLSPMLQTVPPGPNAHILGWRLYYILRRSPTLNPGGTYSVDGMSESHRDFFPTTAFRLSVERRDQGAEVWLAAYIGNYIGNCLSYLNDVLTRVEIEQARTDIKTKLLVKWERVAATLGSLAVFQVLFVSATLLYCRRNFEILDDVTAFPSMFAGLPCKTEEERRQEGLVNQGRFVAEGDGFRWVCALDGDKDGKEALLAQYGTNTL